MSKAKLTPWFPGGVKPVRPGVYQQKAGVDIGYQFWDGVHWGLWARTPDGAVGREFARVSMFQNDPWRGLAEKPS